MVETLTKEYFDTKIDEVLRTVKVGFDGVSEQFKAVDERFEKIDERFERIDERFERIDARFNGVEKRFNLIDEEFDHIKQRLSMLENEVRALSANMVTKQYLDAKVEQLQVQQQKDSLFKRSLLLALEQAKVLAPDVRAKLEMLIA